MPQTRTVRTRFVTALVLLSACLLLSGVVRATAEPESATSLQQAAERSGTTVNLGGVDASLESSRPAIAAGDPFGFTARVRAEKRISYLQVRLKVFRPSGRLIFQRTRIENSVPPGAREFHFERQTDDLDLQPGTYPVELQVTVQGPDGRLEDVITSELRVFDPKAAPTDLVMVVRVTGEPLSGPDGSFRDDPARSSATLDELDRLLTASAEKDLRFTLSVAPMLLEEWKRVSAGYELSGDPEPVEVPRTDPVPTRYAQVLDSLQAAMDAGRVELLFTGYSDPDLSELAARGLRPDISVQYRQGLSSAYASLESTPSTGSAPAGGCVPPAATPYLASEELGYVLVENRCVRRGDATVTAGVYRAVDTTLAVVVADATAGAQAASGDVRAVTARAFGRHASKARAPFVVIAEVGPAGSGTAEGVIRSATELVSQPWLEQRLARDVAATPGTEVRIVSAAPDPDPPAGYWDAVVAGRQWTEALAFAGGEARRDTARARTASLIAESAGWAQAQWALADRGVEYAKAAEKTGRNALEPVALSLQPLTLSGTEGNVPITISNGTDDALRVTVTVRPGGNLKLSGERERSMELKPAENFFEVPVTLQNALTGDLTVSVRAGQVVLREETVTVQASYLDRLAIIAGIVVLLGGMLAYIIRRVRTVEARERVRERGGRYTESVHDGTEDDT